MFIVYCIFSDCLTFIVFLTNDYCNSNEPFTPGSEKGPSYRFNLQSLIIHLSSTSRLITSDHLTQSNNNNAV